MSTPPIGEAIRVLVTGTRHARSVMSQADRNLAAATLIGVAVFLAWPKDKPVPQVLHRLSRLGQHPHDRRSWSAG